MPPRRYYTVGMVLLLMVIGAAWLAALCRHAIPVVYVTVAMIPLSWFLGAATAAQLGNAPSAAVFVACGLLSLLWLRCVRRKLELTAALIQEATQVLSSHPSLVAAALGILLGLLVLYALLGTSIVLLIATGSWQLEGGGRMTGYGGRPQSPNPNPNPNPNPDPNPNPNPRRELRLRAAARLPGRPRPLGGGAAVVNDARLHASLLHRLCASPHTLSPGPVVCPPSRNCPRFWRRALTPRAVPQPS